MGGVQIKVIYLTQGKVALIDDEDYERVSMFVWSFNGGYAKRNIGKRPFRYTQLLHKFIVGTDEMVDHINRNKLDCQRHNLRVCTKVENCMNRSLTKNKNCKGVQQLTSRRWTARITVNQKLIYLGTFDTENEAMNEYDRMAILAFGEFACTNKELRSK